MAWTKAWVRAWREAEGGERGSVLIQDRDDILEGTA